MSAMGGVCGSIMQSPGQACLACQLEFAEMTLYLRLLLVNR